MKYAFAKAKQIYNLWRTGVNFVLMYRLTGDPLKNSSKRYIKNRRKRLYSWISYSSSLSISFSMVLVPSVKPIKDFMITPF